MIVHGIWTVTGLETQDECIAEEYVSSCILSITINARQLVPTNSLQRVLELIGRIEACETDCSATTSIHSVVFRRLCRSVRHWSVSVLVD